MNKKTPRRLIIIAILIIIVCGVVIKVNKLKTNSNAALKFTQNMKIGWNLGNTFDAYDVAEHCNSIMEFETIWGNPVTDKRMIDDIKAAGFNTIRIPVTWYEHMDSEGNISEEWIKRIKEVADYGIANEMYVILNVHHDPWYYPSEENTKNAISIIRKVWNQISLEFIYYDEHLIFEGLNEPRLVGTEYEWSEGTKEARAIINEFNAEFVKTVRAAGGENINRYLMIPTYAACTDDIILKELVIPDDEKIIVSVHAYIPYEYALGKNTVVDFNVNNTADTKIIDDVMQKLYDEFISKGIPVVIGEFAATSLRDDDSRALWAEYFVKSAASKNITCIWWDNGCDDKNNEGTLLYDRNNRKIEHRKIIEALMNGIK